MLLLWCLVVLGSLSQVNGQFDLVVPQNNGELYERVCQEIERIRKDYKFYIQMYKNLLQEVYEKYPNSNFCRELLNEMFATIKCILDLANDMDNLKRILRSNEPLLGRARFRGFLEGWLLFVQEKQDTLFRLADEIREKESTVDPGILSRFDELNVMCIDMVQEGVLNLLQGEVIFAAEQAQAAFDLDWASPVPGICRKVALLKKLCLKMMAEFRALRDKLKNKKFSGRYYPNAEMNQLCNCIIEYCRCIYELIDICENANNMTPMELEKRLCEWLLKIKEIRNRLIDYWEALVKHVLKVARQLGVARFFKKYFANSPFVNYWKLLDECIFKIECYYIQITLGEKPLVRG